MLDRTINVFKNKNKVEKAMKARRKNELVSLKKRSAYKAKLYDELKHIEVILQDNDVDAVKITVPDNQLAQFSASIYAEDLASYDVTQVEGDANSFFIRRKFVAF
jgi:uncharacterized protein YpuA (DUF1002 family)